MNRPIINNYLKATSYLEDDYFNYFTDLDKYCDELEMKNAKLEQRLRMFNAEVNPCKGCTDYCYKNDECKSNGGCGNKDIDEKLKRLQVLENLNEELQPVLHFEGNVNDLYLIYWICPNCGKEHEHIHNYCPDCGQHINTEELKKYGSS